MIAYRFDPGPIHLVRLPTGADLYEALTGYVGEHDIQSASVSFLGAVRRAALRYYAQQEREYRDFVVDRHLEVLAGIGNVSLLDGAPFLHIHAAFADETGTAYGGHVNVGTEVFAIEVSLHELSGEAPIRRLDEQTGLMVWGPPER